MCLSANYNIKSNNNYRYLTFWVLHFNSCSGSKIMFILQIALTSSFTDSWGNIVVIMQFEVDLFSSSWWRSIRLLWSWNINYNYTMYTFIGLGYNTSDDRQHTLFSYLYPIPCKLRIGSHDTSNSYIAPLCRVPPRLGQKLFTVAHPSSPLLNAYCLIKQC